ncbi:MAG: TonB family protein [Gammaproteobacteria bacterium]
MNQTFELIVNAVGWTLLHFLWQGAIIFVLFALSRSVMSTANPTVRHGNAFVWLVLLMLLPLLTFTALLFSSPATHSTFAVSSVAFVAPSASWTDQTGALGGLSLLGAMWLSGVIVLSVRLFRDWRALGRFTCAGAEPLPQLDNAFAALLEAMDIRLNVRLKIRLVEAVNASVPMVVGVLKPMVVIPSSALLGLTSRELELIIAHELAHLKRHDHLINYLLLIAETLLFFHPVVYTLTRTIRHERELCCDDLVINTFDERVCYARALSKLEALRSLELVPTASLRLAAVDGPLVVRISRLVQRRTHRQWDVISTAMLPVVAAIFVGLVFYKSQVAPGSLERGSGLAQTLEQEPAAQMATALRATHEFTLEPIQLAEYSRRYIDASTVSRITAALTQSLTALPLSAIEQGADFPVRSSRPAALVASSRTSKEGRLPVSQRGGFDQSRSDEAAINRNRKSESGRLPGTSTERENHSSAGKNAGVIAESTVENSTSKAQLLEDRADSSRIAYDMTEISTLYAPVTRHTGMPALSFTQSDSSAAASEQTKTAQLNLPETLTGGELIHSVTPRYPVRARSRGFVDKVIVSIRIDSTGKVDEVSVVNQDSRPMFQRAVVRAVSKWKFEPLLRNGEAVEQILEQSFNFQLQPYTAGRPSQTCSDTKGVVCRRAT